ncbi:MAG: deoxyribose-phosphate aldolase [Nitrospirota bacterium]|nr:deoxyribose-phosphate aldolase [Nitrospirota bacterium]
MFESAAVLAGLIDHTLVRPDASLEELDAACSDARTHGFAALIVNGWQVARAKEALKGSSVRVGAVIGFPHGTCTTTVKIMEAMEAMRNGAEELDIVMNLGMFRSGKPEMFEIDIKNVVTMTKGLTHKIIIETSALRDGELDDICRIVVRSGATFVKTSTGYGARGASVDDIRSIRAAVGTTCLIKASGGIKDLSSVVAMVAAGADRIGTSAGPAIMAEYLRSRQ